MSQAKSVREWLLQFDGQATLATPLHTLAPPLTHPFAPVTPSYPLHYLTGGEAGHPCHATRHGLGRRRRQEARRRLGRLQVAGLIGGCRGAPASLPAPAAFQFSFWAPLRRGRSQLSICGSCVSHVWRVCVACVFRVSIETCFTWCFCTNNENVRYNYSPLHAASEGRKATQSAGILPASRPRAIVASARRV